MNYFIWRQQDCVRNSISAVAQSFYSHKELHCKSSSDMHEMIHRAGKNWATDYTDGEKNGRLIVKEKCEETICTEAETKTVRRTRWVSKGAWKFTENKEKLLDMIPEYSI